MKRKEQTINSKLFDVYFPEFMWRKKYDNIHQNDFANIVDSISEQYPILTFQHLLNFKIILNLLH